MTVEDREAGAVDEEQLPPDEETEGSSGSEESTPPQAQPSQRERELELRLTRNGRELAESRRAQQQMAATLASLQQTVKDLAEGQTATEQREAERREREMQEYLASLPEDKRLVAEVDLLKKEVKTLRQGPATGAQTARATTSAATRTSPQEDPEVAYMRQRANEIIARAQTKFGVQITQADIPNLPDDAWESEEDFAAAIYDLAANKKKAGPQGDSTVPGKKNDQTQETPAEMEERIKRDVMRSLGVASSAAPRASGKPGKAPTAEDIQTTVSTYSSAAGPRANIAKLKEQRQKLGMG